MKLSFKQTLLIILLILTPLVVSLLPFFIQAYMSPPDRVFMGLHRWSEDYYGYLQSINQGLMGHIQAVSKLTLEPHQPTFVHSEYVLLGFIGRFFGLNAPLVYHLSRLFLGAIFVFVAFYFFYFLFTKSSNKRVADAEVGKFSRSRFLTPQKIFYQRGGRQDPLFRAFLAFFLAFFVAGFPRLSSLSPLRIGPYLPWWTELDVLTRSAILPHYLMGNIFFLLILILFLKFIYSVIPSERSESRDLATARSVSLDSSTSDAKRLSVGMTEKKWFFLLSLFSFLLAFVHPIDFLILVCSLGLFVVLNIIMVYVQCHSRVGGNLYNIDLRVKPEDDKANKLFTKYQILLLLLVFLSGLLPALYYRFALSLPFWRFILAHGTTTPYNIPLFDLSLALGPVFFLTLLYLSLRGIRLWRMTKQSSSPEKRLPRSAAYGVLARNDSVRLLLFSWLFIQTLFFLKLYQIFNFDRLRTMETPFYIPLAFFATIFITKMCSNVIPSDRRESRDLAIVKSVSLDSSTPPAPEDGAGSVGMTRKGFCLLTFALLAVLLTLPPTIMGLKNQIYSVSDLKTFSLFSYPTAKQYQAWQFLKEHTPDNSAITTLYEEKFLLPTVSGNKIAFGANFDNDKNYQNNVNIINKMYAGLLSPEDLQNFLHTYHIQYIYWGYQEQSLGGDLTKYSFLQKIFNNGEVTVFKVK